MAIQWIDGFDELPDTNINTFLTSEGYITASGVGQALGRGERGRCLTLNNGSVRKTLTTSTEFHIGFGFKTDGTPQAQNILQLVDAALTPLVTLQRGASNELILTTGSNTATTPAEVIHIGVWAYIEIRAFLHVSSSALEIRVNNQPLASLSFAHGGATSMEQVVLTAGAGAQHRYDDLVVLDSTGTVNVSFLGDVYVENVALTSNASPIQFSPVGSVINVQNINETGPADDTKYNASSTLGAQDMFNLSDLNILTDEVFGVQIGVRARKFGSGPALIAAVLDDGVNPEVVSMDMAPDADFRTLHKVFSEKPAGGQWDVTTFNNLKIGYKITG